jgi:hypothetical protein
MNTGALEGMVCPNCKSEGPFEICASCMFTVHDDGTFVCWATSTADLEWPADATCYCPECDHDTVVAQFYNLGDPAE